MQHCLNYTYAMKHLTQRQRYALFNTWTNIIERCYNPTASGFAHYGGRGIGMCERWLNSFDAFASDMGARPEGFSIDRIDVNKGYAPDNCRWADRFTQARNKRTTKLSTKDIESLLQCIGNNMSPEGLAVAYGVTAGYVRILAAKNNVALPYHQKCGKLTREQVVEIRAIAATGVTGRDIAKRFGVSETNVSSILTGRSWKHVDHHSTSKVPSASSQ